MLGLVLAGEGAAAVAFALFLYLVLRVGHSCPLGLPFMHLLYGLTGLIVLVSVLADCCIVVVALLPPS